MTKKRPSQIVAVLTLAALGLGWAAPSVSGAGSGRLKNRFVLVVEEGETVFLVPPQAPIGTSGPLSLVHYGPVGTFETGLLSNQALAPFLIQALTTGSAIAGPVGGRFALPWGTIEDEHTAWLTLSPEEPKFADRFGMQPQDVAVLIVTAEGAIKGGDKSYRGATGKTKLYLKIEVPKNLSALPICRTAQFVFEFEKP